MIRVLPLLIELALVVYCLIDCIQSDEAEVRNLRKIWWVLLILFFPLVGAIAWLVAGRPKRDGRRSGVPWPSTRTAGFPEYERPRRQVAPDDDPEFLENLRRSNRDHEDMLKKWEDDLRRREGELRNPDDGEDKPPASTP